MEPTSSPKPKRRFRFSLRTLMIVVLVYAGLWTMTAVWGGRQLEGRVAEYAGQLPRVDLAHAGTWNENYWAAETTAYAPFLLGIKYVVTQETSQTITIEFNTIPDTHVLHDFQFDEQDCLILWFFGKTWKLPPGHQSIGREDPVFGRG